MPHPHIYIGTTPDTPTQRRAMRTLALDLRVRLRSQRDPAPVLALLHFPIEGAGVADLLIARPNALILAALRTFDGPLEITHQLWRDIRGQAIREGEGQTPLAIVGLQRDTLRARLLEALPAESLTARAAQRLIAAVVCMPLLHADSRIALDIEDHRAQRKILGIDELPGLSIMAAGAVRLTELDILELIEHLGGQLWHDGSRLLFELAPPRHQLQVLNTEQAVRTTLPLIEGENMIGRRRTARPHEHRLTITGDDLVSSDHALLICHEDGRVTLRDTSKNGTWVTLPDGPETFVHATERQLIPGTILRLGDTRMQLMLSP